jgi:acyl-CoA reductase-like NAD-dependent aldehyde dehydrogenase
MVTVYHPIVAGRERQSGNRFPVLDKYTGESFAEVGLPEPKDIEQAIAAADDSKKAMQDLSSFQRCDIVRKAAALLAERKDELALTIAREAGKPYKYATFEVERTVENL